MTKTEAQFTIKPESAALAPRVELLLDRVFGADRREKASYLYREGVAPVAPLSFVALDQNKKLHVARVQVGLSDGQKTEVSGKGLEDGMQVVISVASGDAAPATSAASTSNPFQPGRPQGARVGGR